MSIIKVLVVDDHPLIRDGIRALLDIDDKIEIVGEASEGKEAVEKAQKLAPDVIIMDIAMPVVDGLKATQLITQRNPKIKVLILTQHDGKEYVLSTIKAGAVGFLPKRALGSDLISAIHALYRGDTFLYHSAVANLMENYRQHAEENEPYRRLTPREKETLKLIARGYTSREIADMLSIHLRTVTGYRIKIMKKLDLHNRAEIIRYAIDEGLMSTE
jgi:two-component system response regulator NreC